MRQSVKGMLAITVAGTLAIGVSAACGLIALASPISHQPAGSGTATPIRHIVVIFQENVSFDHYFGTCPNAANTDGQPFRTKPGTPRVNGLKTPLLTHNPNEYNPRRISPSQALTCDQDHAYTAEQKAFDGGLMDKFVQYTGNSDCTLQLPTRQASSWTTTTATPSPGSSTANPHHVAPRNVAEIGHNGRANHQ